MFCLILTTLWLVFIYTYSKRRLDRTKKQCYSNIGKYPSNLLGIRGEGEYVKLSTKGRYGLRAMIDLARYSEEEPVSISSIAARQDISERYLEQLMGLLRKAGLVQSIRGATGGYILTRSAGEISVGDVLRALEGSLEPVKCAAFYSEKGCTASGGCVTKYVWQKINESINETVDKMMLDELVRESRIMNPEGELENPECNA